MRKSPVEDLPLEPMLSIEPLSRLDEALVRLNARPALLTISAELKANAVGMESPLTTRTTCLWNCAPFTRAAGYHFGSTREGIAARLI